MSTANSPCEETASKWVESGPSGSGSGLSGRRMKRRGAPPPVMALYTMVCPSCANRATIIASLRKVCSVKPWADEARGLMPRPSRNAATATSRPKKNSWGMERRRA